MWWEGLYRKRPTPPFFIVIYIGSWDLVPPPSQLLPRSLSALCARASLHIIADAGEREWVETINATTKNLLKVPLF